MAPSCILPPQVRGSCGSSPCPCGNGLFPVDLDTQWLVLLLQPGIPHPSENIKVVFPSLTRKKQKAPHPFCGSGGGSGFRPSCTSFAHPLPLVPGLALCWAAALDGKSQRSLKSHPACAGRRDLNKESDFLLFFCNPGLEMKSLPELAPGIPPVTLQNRPSPDVAGISAVEA